MSRKRQIVLMAKRLGGGGPVGVLPDEASMPPLGSGDEVVAKLAPFNTAPDGGGGGALGTMTLHGPGMVVLMPTTQKMITQLIASLTDEEIALPVLMRACKALGWTMMDMETGRTFG